MLSILQKNQINGSGTVKTKLHLIYIECIFLTAQYFEEEKSNYFTHVDLFKGTV